jgi:hydrogenase 3 maturation protease
MPAPGASRPPRLAIVGVGQELNGDDAAGLAVIRSLRRSSGSEDGGHLLLLEGGPSPENVTGALRRFEPDLVLLVDAALMGLEPGAVRWLDWQESDGVSASTHTLPLRLVATFLTQELGCQVGLLGIEPAGTTFGDPISPPVRAAVSRTARALARLTSPPSQG